MSSAKPIGDIDAKCPRCGHKTFNSAAGPEHKPEDLLTCASCGHVVKHKELVAQIGTEANKRAKKVLGKIVSDLNKRR